MFAACAASIIPSLEPFPTVSTVSFHDPRGSGEVDSPPGPRDGPQRPGHSAHSGSRLQSLVRSGHEASVSPIRGLLQEMQGSETLFSLSVYLRTSVTLRAC